jgi:hypothetical protein
MNSDYLILPITDFLEGSYLDEFISLGEIEDSDSPINFIYFNPASSTFSIDNSGAYTSLDVIITRELSLAIPFIDGAMVILGTEEDGFFDFKVSLQTTPFCLKVSDISVTLHFPPRIIQSYLPRTSIEDEWQINEGIDGYNFTLTNISLRVNGDGDIDSSLPIFRDLSPAMIGDTGFIVDLDSIRIITGTIPSNLTDILFPGFKGLYISNVSLYYHKPDSGTRIPGIHLEHAAIGSGGFSGKGIVGNAEEEPEISSEQLNDPDFDLRSLGDRYLVGFELGGMDIVLWHFSASFVKSIPESGSLTGLFKTGLSDRWFKFRASLGGPDGDFMLEVGGAGSESLISLEHEYFEITADSIAYKVDDGVHYAVISGSIQPKIEGFDWPAMQIEDLSISSEGDISIPGGWITAPETITLNFSAFKIGINEIGFGNEEQEPESEGVEPAIRQWLGFSGELNLVEGLDIKASVDGLKFSWPKGGGDVTTTLKGIAVEFEIPNTLSLKGSVKFEELTDENNGGTGLTGKLFRGNVNLKLMTVRLEIEAELIIGKLTDSDGNQFTSFFIVLGAQLPAGIPLGATGVSLYGIKALGAMNAGPTKTEEQNWYEWYMAAPERNITSIDKYKPIAGYNAFGAGVTIGTMFDDGFTLNMSVMLAVLLPGPVIILEGKANLLKQRMDGQQEQGGPEGAFYLLAVLDGRAGTFMLNVDVKYSLKDIITIGASLEAFFDFNDSSNWYVYIGRKPEEKRIRAEILSLFGANAYFMIDNSSFQTGASVGFDFRKKYGPVQIFLVAKIGFDATIFWQPMQLEGALELEAALGIKVFGIGLELYIYMLMEGRVPEPYWIHGIAEVGIKLFWPLPDISLRVELEWSQPAPTLPVWPLLKECTFIHHKGSGSTWTALMHSVDDPQPDWSAFPIVPVDARPVLTFARPFYNLQRETNRGLIPVFNGNIDKVGGTVFTYKLDNDELLLQKYDFTDENWVNVRKSINLDDDYDDTDDIYDNTDDSAQTRKFLVDKNSIINMQNGTNPQEPKIQLWKYSAGDHNNEYTTEDESINHPTCLPRVLLGLKSVEWLGIPNGTMYEYAFSYAGLTFVISQSAVGSRPQVKNDALHCGSITISFPEPIYYIGLELQGYSSGSALYNGEFVSALGNDGANLLYNGYTPVNSIHLVSANPDTFYNTGSGRLESLIKKITYMTRNSSSNQSGGDDPSPGATRQNVNGDLVLEPATYYRLKVTTSVDVDETVNDSHASDYLYFRTDEGPGIDSISGVIDSTTIEDGKLLHKDKPVNQLVTYIDQTLPVDGALNHYLEHDVGVQFNESYVEKLYKQNSISMRFRDRNGKVLNTAEGSFWGLGGFLPLFHNGMLSWIKNKEEGGCNATANPVPPAPYLNFSLRNNFKARNLYSAEMLVNTDLGENLLHEFQFTSSRYSNFREHVLGEYNDNLIEAITLPSQRLGGIYDFSALITEKSAYVEKVARFYDDTEADALQQFELLTEIKDVYKSLNEISEQYFTQLDKVISDSLRVVDMLNRPAAEKFEIFKVGFTGSRNECVMLIESPEPIDWLRVKAKAKRGNGSRLILEFIWNKDKTRAFMFSPFTNSFYDENHEIEFSYSGEKDPISGIILRNNEIVNETMGFRLLV